MYFDTLKVSTVEQSAQQSSARGGVGNAEHVIWDFGKEITVTLQDALYTPASQKMLWEGTYGLRNMGIYGRWNPYVYSKDEYGNYIYYEKHVAKPEDPNIPSNAVEIICPCDDEHKFLWFTPAAATLKFESPVETTLKRHNKAITYSSYERFKTFLIYEDKNFTKEMDKAVVNVENFADFYTKTYDINENYSPGGTAQYQVQPTTDLAAARHRLLEYFWKSCDLKMTTLENNYDLAYKKDVNFCIHSQYNNENKRIYFKEQDRYLPSIEFTQTITKEIVDCNGETVEYTFEVPLGIFYIVEDYNIGTPSEENAIFNLSDVNTTNTTTSMVKLVANDTFAIDVDKNIKVYQFFQQKKYNNTEMQCFIDPSTMQPFTSNSPYFTTARGVKHYGNLRVIKQGEVYYKYVRRNKQESYLAGKQIVVNAKTFPGAFKLVGETTIKDRYGEEQGLQIEIPLCKLSNNSNFTLEAAGEPVTVDMSFKVLRRFDGTMVKLTYHDLEDNCLVPEEPEKPGPSPEPVITTKIFYDTYLKSNDTILTKEGTNIGVYCIPYDCREPYTENFEVPDEDTPTTYLTLGYKEEEPLTVENRQDLYMAVKKTTETYEDGALKETDIEWLDEQSIKNNDNIILTLSIGSDTQ